MSTYCNLFRCNREEAFVMLRSMSNADRLLLSRQIGLCTMWIKCTQNVGNNRILLVRQLIRQSVDPCIRLKYRVRVGRSLNNFLNGRGSFPVARSHESAALDYRGEGVCKMIKRSRGVFEVNFNSTVSFVQNVGGMGINIHKHGLILTCAHVVAYGEDDALKVSAWAGSCVGRLKTVMFPSGELYVTRCIYSCATDNGRLDCALLKILNRGGKVFPVSTFAKKLPPRKSFCFTIGTSAYSKGDECEVTHPFHLSVGRLVGVSRKEGYSKLMHTCWTYGGYSGGGIFDRKGQICGMHCEMDDEDGVRHAVDLKALNKFIERFMRKVGNKAL